MTPNPICVPPETLVSDAVVLMLERGFRHLPLVAGTKILGVFSVRDALPREIGTALSQAEFNEQVNDVLGYGCRAKIGADTRDDLGHADSPGPSCSLASVSVVRLPVLPCAPPRPVGLLAIGNRPPAPSQVNYRIVW